MAISSELTGLIQERESFPIIKRSMISSLIVLFTSSDTGMVIFGDSMYSVGYYAHDWAPYDDVDNWETFDRVVSLFNK